jgi:hypothetical protein
MRTHLSISLAAAALVIAVLGSAPVAGALHRALVPPHRVGTEQLKADAVVSTKIRNGSVAGLDVRKGTLTSVHVRDGSLLASDFRPGQLPAGAKGAKGDPGATNVVFRRDQTALASAGLAQAVAQCAAGETLVSGGAALLRAGDTLANDPSVEIVASYPATAGITAASDGATATRWVAVARVSEPSSTRLVVFASCARP